MVTVRAGTYGCAGGAARRWACPASPWGCDVGSRRDAARAPIVLLTMRTPTPLHSRRAPAHTRARLRLVSDAPTRPLSTVRAVGLVLMCAYALVRLRHEGWWDPLDDLNLAVHEAGHIIFSPFGETMTILGGSLFQVIVPAVFVAYFARTRQRFGAAVTLAWVGASLLNVARYIADARARELPLLGGDDSAHDWWQLLSNWDALPSDHSIALVVRAAAAMTFLVGISLGFVALGDAQGVTDHHA